MSVAVVEEENKLTCGTSAQKRGDALLRIIARTSPIFFFLTSDFSRALNVRLLPEYIYENGLGIQLIDTRIHILVHREI